MSFLTAAPEITSLLIYWGAGSGPMLSAAAAWDGLAAELGSAAESFASVISNLAGGAWQGPASQAATQATGAAAQAKAVASAFESALAATVHPAMVSANRGHRAADGLAAEVVKTSRRGRPQNRPNNSRFAGGQAGESAVVRRSSGRTPLQQ